RARDLRRARTPQATKPRTTDRLRPLRPHTAIDCLFRADARKPSVVSPGGSRAQAGAGPGHGARAEPGSHARLAPRLFERARRRRSRPGPDPGRGPRAGGDLSDLDGPL